MVEGLTVEHHVGHTQVDIGCQATIEHHFALTIGATRLSLSEVEEPESDGLVQLEHPIADEEERRNVGFDDCCLLEGRCRWSARWSSHPEYLPVPVPPRR